MGQKRTVSNKDILALIASEKFKNLSLKDQLREINNHLKFLKQGEKPLNASERMEIKKFTDDARKNIIDKVELYNLIGSIESLRDKKHELKRRAVNLKYQSLISEITGEHDNIPLLEATEKLLNILNEWPEDDEQEPEAIETTDKVPHMLVLFKELGIYDILNDRIEENNGTTADLEKLIAYLIKHDNPGTVGRYFSGMEPGSQSKDKHNPYTAPALKYMEKVLHECNIKIKGNYPKRKKTE